MISRLIAMPWKQLKTYRCPACDELVDNTDREAVRLHHDHVLHPRQEILARHLRPAAPAEQNRSASRK